MHIVAVGHPAVSTATADGGPADTDQSGREERQRILGDQSIRIQSTVDEHVAEPDAAAIARKLEYVVDGFYERILDSE